MAKKNLGTKINDAPLVIGLGPGFHVGEDVHMIVETNNTENLGRVILSGEAEPDTGIALNIEGLTDERVLRVPAKGLFHAVKEMGDLVSAGDTVAWVEEEEGQERVSADRIREAEATGADTLAVGCPFCMMMLSDASQNGMQIRDVAEIVAERVS